MDTSTWVRDQYSHLIPSLNGKSVCSYLGSGYEWDVGHFEGAERPNVDCFRSTSFGLSEEVTRTALALMDRLFATVG